MSGAWRLMRFRSWWQFLGSSLGIAFGCLVGMLPLAVIALMDRGEGESETHRESTPKAVFVALAQRLTDVLHCDRYALHPLGLDFSFFEISQTLGGSGTNCETADVSHCLCISALWCTKWTQILVPSVATSASSRAYRYVSFLYNAL